MPIPDRTKIPTEDPKLEWIVTDDGSRTLRNVSLDETYHSGCGAVTECWYVYLANSGVLERLSNKRPTTVLEYGFGTGTSFWLTASLAETCQAELTYIAFENELLAPNVLDQTLASQEPPEFDLEAIQPSREAIREAGKSIRKQLVRYLGELPRADVEVPSFRYCKLTEHVSLLLCNVDANCVKWEDVEHALNKSNHSGHDEQSIYCDAIYFDPFSPDTNPDLWTAEVFDYARQRLEPHGKLVSYCVKGSVRRTLEGVGFRVERVQGPPGGKREVLLAYRS